MRESRGIQIIRFVLLPIFCLFRGEQHGQQNAEGQDGDNHHQGGHNADFNTHQRQEHLHTNEGQQYRQTDTQIGEFVHNALQHEEHGTQAQNGENIGEKDDMRVMGDRENSRNRVEGENDVRKFDDDQHHKQRRAKPTTIHLREEIVSVERRST